MHEKRITMKIECISNKIDALSSVDREHVHQHVHKATVDLSIAKSYNVYGIIFRAGNPWYLICEETESEYPVPHFGGFFRIVDNRIPPDWGFLWHQGPWPDGAFIPVIWQRNGFFEALLDGVGDAIQCFQRERARIDRFG